MNLLTVICSRNPTKDLIDCLEGIKQFYPDADIAIIDSDSDATEVYRSVDVPVHYLKNKNYELGAWKLAYELYGDYDAYLCIKDTLIPQNRLPVETLCCDQVMSYFNMTGFKYDDLADLAIELTEDTIYHDVVSKHRISEDFRLATHNSFLIPNGKLSYLINALPNLPVDKRGSMAYERILGLAITQSVGSVIRMNHSFNKRHGSRQ